MRKPFRLLIMLLLLSLLCSCGEAGLSSVATTPSAGSAGNTTTSPETESSVSPSPNASAAPEQVDNTARGILFRAFLQDNYQKLSDAFFGGISGVGFIDLDMDGGIEMLVFDAGASAAMGLQFFDIIDGAVECISANMTGVGTSFGGAHMSSVIVCANHFDDFRLVSDKTTGEEFFIVQSGNGAVDFSYSELVRFGSDDGVLTLTPLLYKYTDFDIDSGATKAERFKIANKDADKTSYETAYTDFFSGIEDTNYDAKGVFLWENTQYENGLDGLLAMSDKALTLFEIKTNS